MNQKALLAGSFTGARKKTKMLGDGPFNVKPFVSSESHPWQTVLISYVDCLPKGWENLLFPYSQVPLKVLARHPLGLRYSDYEVRLIQTMKTEPLEARIKMTEDWIIQQYQALVKKEEP